MRLDKYTQIKNAVVIDAGRGSLPKVRYINLLMSRSPE
jgi:hypothetical protein